jgi:hypothetical protein
MALENSTLNLADYNSGAITPNGRTVALKNGGCKKIYFSK